jgi:hypothetical protein
VSSDGSDGQEHGGHDRKQSIGVTPALVVDDPLDQRHHDEGSGADAGHGEAQRERSPRFEPAADRRDHRHVAACNTEPDAEAVREVADLERLDLGSEEESDGHRRRAEGDDPARAMPVGDAAGHDPEREVGEGRQGKEQRRFRPVGAELISHRAEEFTEAVGHPEHREHRQEGRCHDDPRARRIDAVDRWGIGGRGLAQRRVTFTGMLA